MIIPFEKILAELPKKPKRVLHIGAERGSEKETYEKFGLDYFFVEASLFVYNKLIERVDPKKCLNAAVTDQDDKFVKLFQVFSKDRSNLGCSSVLQPTGILNNQYLEQVESVVMNTITIDTIDRLYGPFDILNMDIQGAEMLALAGANQFLSNPKLQGIILEFNTVSYYEGDCQLGQLDEFLAKYDFERVITEFATDEQVWGDFLAVRKEESDPDMVYGVHKSQR